MTRYAVIVRRWWTVPAALVVVITVCLVVGANEIPVPTLSGGMGSAQLAYFTPVLLVVALMYCLDRRLPDVEAVAVLSVKRLDEYAVVITVLLAHAAGSAVGLNFARNVMLVLALALLTRRVANEAAAAGVSLLFLIANVLLGRGLDPDGQVTHTWWAVSLYPAGSRTAWLVSCALFLLSLPLAFSKTAARR
ncbi:hypothetical protein GT034_17410 [Streptomyces sp. SID2563]|uniref:hypothetical protein n=1 Tax=Streptomyces sp. SID2563 TaxID=2690255 RepID=UPI0013681BA0|nr:hypothetical protein [Streptomyces sp. SID2563]MYW10114.1 hypothetical protein [Streptomyces sp. SID2563]